MTQGVRVWDAPTRLFHWLLVAGFAGMWYSGKQGGDLLQYHIWCGIGIAGLLLFRLLWGVVGSDTARFARFVRGPGAIARYLKGEPLDDPWRKQAEAAVADCIAALPDLGG
jgi:cytochrome b